MPNSMKKKRDKLRNRARIFRGVNSILKQDENSSFNVIELKKKMFGNESVTNNEEKSKSSSLSSKLRTWAIEYHVRRRALSALLKILISFGMTSLPRDSRTLLKTPRIVEIENRAGGSYWHNGLSNCLRKIFAKLACNMKIKLNFNMDGLPLFKSSPLEFWPILANVHGN